MNMLKPYLLFVGNNYGKAGGAVELYKKAFDDVVIIKKEHYKDGEPGGCPDGVKAMTISIRGDEIMFEDSSYNHGFTFTPAIPLYIELESSTKIKRAYKVLSQDGQPLVPLSDEESGNMFVWLNGKYGVSWQLTVATP